MFEISFIRGKMKETDTSSSEKCGHTETNPQICSKHNTPFQELWAGEWICETCFEQVFHYQNEGLEGEGENENI